MGKKLLFIDDQILRFDQAAGARTSYMYLKLLLEMGFSVTFIGADFNGIEPYTSHLRALGIKVLTGRWFLATWRLWFLLFSREYDYVFFNRPFPTKRFIGYVKKFSKAKTIYQCHDLHYLRLLRQYELDRDANTLKQAQLFEQLETDLIRKTDVFLTFSQDEKDLIAAKLPRQRIETVPLFFYEDLQPPITDFSERAGILFVGGFIHNPNVDAVLWFAREVFPAVREACPEMVCYIAGSNPPAEVRAIDGDGIEILGYVSDEELAKLYSKVRLVVVPLRFGAGVKGKTVEAIHHALPLVATGIGVEGIGLEDLVPPTDDAAAFAERILALYPDESALRACSSSLHDYARNHLTKRSAKARMAHVLGG